MNKIDKIINRIKSNDSLLLFLKGILMGIMLISIFLRLMNSELTSPPEFIYNQF